MTCDQRTTHCYFKSKGETCVGSSQCPYKDEAKAKRGCGFACKADADCNASCGVCDKGYCQAQPGSFLKRKNDKVADKPPADWEKLGCGFGPCQTNDDCSQSKRCGVCDESHICQAQR